MQQTEFSPSSQEALVKWGLELIWFPPIKIICSKHKSHKMPIKVRVLAQWITLEMGLAHGWEAAGTRAAQTVFLIPGTRAVGCVGSTKFILTLLFHVSWAKQHTEQDTNHHKKQGCLPFLTKYHLVIRTVQLWICTCSIRCAVKAIRSTLTATFLKSRLLQHAKDCVFRWCKSA